jgi:hypothetical protein
MTESMDSLRNAFDEAATTDEKFKVLFDEIKHLHAFYGAKIEELRNFYGAKIEELRKENQSLRDLYVQRYNEWLQTPCHAQANW